MLKFLKDRRNFNAPATLTGDKIVNQNIIPTPVETEPTPSLEVPSVNEYEDRLTPTPEFLETEPTQEKPTLKRTPKKK